MVQSLGVQTQSGGCFGAIKRLNGRVEALGPSQAMIGMLLLAIKSFSWRQNTLLTESEP